MNARTIMTWQRMRNALLVALFIVCVGIVTYAGGSRAASCGIGTIAGVRAVGDDGNVPGNVLDGKLDTRWSHEGDDTWQIWIVNRAYGTSFAAGGAGVGKNMAYTDWMFGR